MFVILCMIITAGMSTRFVHSIDEYKGDARSIAKLLWNACELIAFAKLLTMM